mmetsp:Transcript_28285/g.34357  ORF Transcript_28285/g.34357 Transcript_28285/m.34357 type:complete len:188 (-) Transcript_28285:602-1165(-)|eukprot:CAMPEP_0197847246 /NCGR_PEP_ID=MMETSP1438-20131217/5666_1 /TAXON_ID=1461541 /ORGANISM="Pterosperma sp., Strain CCMP1384" /LENGTH=187 /DNA_ID=CAMNT_0043459117 /DNA_START=133 /DNA_END=696 /DNA_ORIENTATION=-
MSGSNTLAQQGRVRLIVSSAAPAVGAARATNRSTCCSSAKPNTAHRISLGHGLRSKNFAPSIGLSSKRTSVLKQVVPHAAISEEFKEAVDNLINDHKIVLFMKGTKQFPQCGFSNTCVQILNVLEVPYETVNILEDEQLRSGMKEYSMWPTFPQVYMGGEFFGGCDIMIESYQSGELVETVERIMLE